MLSGRLSAARRADQMMNSPSAMSMFTSCTAVEPSGYFLETLSRTMSAMELSFTAPEVRPATIRRWKKSTR